jgi:C4-type Zn-finger protein
MSVLHCRNFEPQIPWHQDIISRHVNCLANCLYRVQECVPVIRARQKFEATTIRLQNEADASALMVGSSSYTARLP